MDTGNMFMVLTWFGVPLPPTTVVSWKHFRKSSLSYFDFHLQNLFAGQPSDSAVGTFKRRVLNRALAGECEYFRGHSQIQIVKFSKFRFRSGVNTAEGLVRKLEEEDSTFGEVQDQRFLRATTTSRWKTNSSENRPNQHDMLQDLSCFGADSW